MSMEIDENRTYKRFLKLESTVNSIKDIIRTTCLNDRECFPRFQIDHRFKDSDNEASISVCFRPSNPDHLFIAVTLVVLISLQYEPDGILEFRYIAFAWNDCITKEDSYDNLKAYHFFNGPYEHEIIKKKINKVLLALIYKGQGLEIEEMSIKYGNSEKKLSHPVQLILEIEDL